jgi:hypothetical protein
MSWIYYDQVYDDISIVLLALARNASENSKLNQCSHFCLISKEYVRNTVNILQNVQHMNRSARRTTLLIEDTMEFPGFTTLKLIAGCDAFISPEYLVETTNGMYFS